MRPPAFVTFTGVDQHARIMDLLALSTEYPVEFGVLFSPKQQGRNTRYPSPDLIQQMVAALPYAHWSAHLCGSAAAQVVEEGHSPYDDWLPKFFRRVQINTSDRNVDMDAVGRWAARLNMRAILQCRGPTFPPVAAVDLLFDQSGGRGLLPTSWPPATRATLCGYAGGLNADNVSDAISVIGAKAQAPYWLDMESGVRNELDRFCVDRCRAVCEAVQWKSARTLLDVPVTSK